MAPSTPFFEGPWLAAVAVVLATIGVLSYGVRAYKRRQRARQRQRHRSLARTFRRFLDGEDSAARIARAAHGVTLVASTVR